MIPENARAWTTVDRDGWLAGPWDDEPDKVSWTDAATGRPCLIVRSPLGSLCGYVAVDPGDPLHGRDYEEVDVEVHGGLTYADRCQDGETEVAGICHVPEPGAPDDVWWFGFDCAHGDDLVPYMQALYPDARAVYRTVAYVVAEVEALARQLVS